VPALWTENPALAAVYDVECAGRHDHDFYVGLAAAVGAQSVVDIGCGTGVFAVDLAGGGHDVIGVDPAGRMLEIARRRSAASSTVHWIHGVADDVPTAAADLAVLMGHVAQYFIADEDWSRTLGQVHRILVPGGRLAFETRNPVVDWAQRWTRERTRATYRHPEGGNFTSWVQAVSVTGSHESYTTTHEGHTVLPDGRHLVASETLRFRSEEKIFGSLDEAGFDIETTWGGWDGSPRDTAAEELIVLAKRR
jgi:SAM-dependent methyltransferase